ncbi:MULTISPECIES: HAD family hydrolase [unclassified Streptomyces]|uniref:HAD family hydrolase n=1 Tax=unclassified Streptomyces TaxID=2593676 RepID=UPI002DDA679A|nr:MULTISPECIES: HAD family hydrolase [unclassified Streptomyces]WSA91198.1 HAD family hydrolase [Streptomyces sp. NBC_01795]WSB75523.1 HAD family hydrolase [Streptomyces sp. NBC_01775]WSS16193.1 HAD family hydrolase [Streptomyces sp. NBC_01186]WSS45012.1 HAD family hydrolase [Streptomyces sp. NBC_01187]
MSAPTGPVRRGVIFDLDGTLADTAPAITAVTAKILSGMGRSPVEAEIRATVGKPLDQNFAQLLGLAPDHADVGHAMGEYRRLFGEHVRAEGRRLLFPGVASGLLHLREAGRKLGIATSKVHAAAVKTVELTSIHELFDAIAGHDSVPRGKPHPDMALRVADEFGLAPEECVVVGDAVGDIEMGVSAGMATIGVGYGVAEAAELTAAGADTVVDSFDAVVTCVLAGIPVGA